MKTTIARHWFTILVTSFFCFSVIRHFARGAEPLRIDNVIAGVIIITMGLGFGLLVEFLFYRGGILRATSVVIVIVATMGYISLVRMVLQADKEMADAVYGGSEYKMNFIRSCFQKSKNDGYCECLYTLLDKEGVTKLPEADSIAFIKGHQQRLSFECGPSEFRQNFVSECGAAGTSETTCSCMFDELLKSNTFQLSDSEMVADITTRKPNLDKTCRL